MHDRVIVQNNPVNLKDPKGLEVPSPGLGYPDYSPVAYNEAQVNAGTAMLAGGALTSAVGLATIGAGLLALPEDPPLGWKGIGFGGAVLSSGLAEMGAGVYTLNTSKIKPMLKCH